MIINFIIIINRKQVEIINDVPTKTRIVTLLII